jgi:hypothetical protein
LKRLFSIIPPLLVLSILFSACSSPEVQYKKQITGALAKYETWNKEAVTAYNRLQEAKTTGNPDATYGQLITNTIQKHIAGDQRRADLTWDRSDFELFKGQAQMVYDGARPLLTELEKMTPPDNMKVAHLVLQECVKYEMNIAATILIFNYDNKFEPVNYSYKPCDTVDGAQQFLKVYAESNK